jgi:hypothetical protein
MFLSLTIPIYSDAQYQATLSELERLGYKCARNFSTLQGDKAVCIATYSNGDYCVYTISIDDYDYAPKTRTRQLRGLHTKARTTTSTDGLSTLEIKPKTVISEPEYVKPKATNSIVDYVHVQLLSLWFAVCVVVNKLVKHFK